MKNTRGAEMNEKMKKKGERESVCVCIHERAARLFLKNVCTRRAHIHVHYYTLYMGDARTLERAYKYIIPRARAREQLVVGLILYTYTNLYIYCERARARSKAHEPRE